MRIAIIGAGNVGRALGSAWGKRGHAIVYGVRDPAGPKVKPLLDSGAFVASPAEAARDGEVVVLALPWGAAEEAVAGLGELAGKIVVDCMNPLAMVDGRLGLDRGHSTSGGEAVQSWLPEARVVKAMNQVGAETMADTSRVLGKPVQFIAGDDDEAKRVVAALVTEIGFEALDAGPLHQARILEPFAMVWINQAMLRGLGRDWAFGVLRASR